MTGTAVPTDRADWRPNRMVGGMAPSAPRSRPSGATGVELKDPDFDAIRRRANFQKLLTELEAKMASGPSSGDKQTEPGK